MTPFTVGQVYRRVQDIMEPYGGQRQGGISTPRRHPMVFLFTGESGATYGYRDEFRPDGSFWYTGEGQTGDMKMRSGNAAIRSGCSVAFVVENVGVEPDGLAQHARRAQERHVRRASLAPGDMPPVPQTLSERARLWPSRVRLHA